jgi:hypothetical protein
MTASIGISRFCRVLGAASLTLLLSAAAWPVWAEVVGTVVQSQGNVTARPPQGVSRALPRNSEVAEGELIETRADSYVRIHFRDNTEITLRPNTRMSIATYKYVEATPKEDNIFFNLLKGGLRAATGAISRRNPQAYRMDGVAATIGIRGTNYGALVCQNDCSGLLQADGKPLVNGLHVDVHEGSVLVSNDVGQTVLSPGQFGYAGAQTTVPLQVPASQGFEVTVPQGFEPGTAGGPTAQTAGGASTGAGASAPVAAAGTPWLMPVFLGTAAAAAAASLSNSSTTHH